MAQDADINEQFNDIVSDVTLSLPIHSFKEMIYGDHDPIPRPIPGLIEGYGTMIFGGPGIGKTTAVQDIAYHIGGARQLGNFDPPQDMPQDGPQRVLLVLAEDVAALTQQRHHQLVGPGEKINEDAKLDFVYGRGWNFQTLMARLDEATREKDPYGVVIVDYIQMLWMNKIGGEARDDYERRMWNLMYTVAWKFGVCFINLAHTNKAGAFAGSNQMLAAAESCYQLKRASEGEEDTAILECLKIRASPRTVDYPLSRSESGGWMFGAVETIGEMQKKGAAKDVLRVLREKGPQPLGHLVIFLDGLHTRSTIDRAIHRLREDGLVVRRQGRWALNPQAGDVRIAANPVCKGCGTFMMADYNNNGYHANCGPQETLPIQRDEEPEPTQETLPVMEEPTLEEGEPTVEELEATPDAEVANDEAVEYRSKEMPWGWKVMETSIEGCKGHPVLWYPVNRRQEAPLSLLSSRTNRTGYTEIEVSAEHRWTLEGWELRHVGGKPVLTAPEGTTGERVGIDRNGSFFSGLSAVKVAANLLLHTGPLEEYDKDNAGLYEVIVPEWAEKDVPHPMGRAGVAVGRKKLISAPTMELLSKLEKEGRMEHTVITDSWTGRSNSNLFRSVYEEAKEIRKNSFEIDPKEYEKKKGQLSRAVRSLYPTQTYSRFYRPDWHLAIRAEASKRLWHKAQQAVREHGAELVFLGNTDMAIFNTPDGNVPANYRIGTAFGEVKVVPSEKWGE